MSLIPTSNQSNLCEYCHQRPKNGQYDYCGRTCSAHAAASAQIPQQPALCKQCRQKPSRQTFDFCGKHCASIWQLQAKIPGGNAPAFTQPSKGLGKFGMPNFTSIENTLKSLQPQSTNQLLPAASQVQPTFGGGLNNNNNKPTTPNSNNVPQQKQSNIKAGSAPDDDDDHDTFGPSRTNNSMASPPMPVSLNGGGTYKYGATAPGNMNNSMAPPTKASQPQKLLGLSSPNAGVCRIPGCDRQVYAAGTMQQSEYCSTQHREAAVGLGADPCIMCRMLPRGTADHFCSWTCRTAALSP